MPTGGGRGAKRVLEEFATLREQIRAGTSGVHDLELATDDDISRWRVRMKDFDASRPGGERLNADLAAFHARHGAPASLLLEIIFDVASFPDSPPFVRVVAPRCEWYTGHVTAGGSVCVSALVPGPGPDRWRPEYRVAAILEMIKWQMVDVERVEVRTRFGPGGTAGPLRVDLEGKWHRGGCERAYSEGEARAAFERSRANHGW